MPDYTIELKSGNNSPIGFSANQGSAGSTATNQVSVAEPPQSVDEQQYAELKELLERFTKSKEFKKLGSPERRKLKDILKDGSHTSGWEKFKSFTSVTANLAIIQDFALTYGPSLAAWIKEARNIVAGASG